MTIFFFHILQCCYLGPRSGHYARIGRGPGPDRDQDKPVLLQAVDDNKDQTYFLCGVPSSALAKVSGVGSGDGYGDGDGYGAGYGKWYYGGP